MPGLLGPGCEWGGGGFNRRKRACRNKCTGIKGGLAYSTDNVYGLPMQKDPSEITHLKQAYSPEVRDSEFGGYDYMEEDEIAYFLADSCPHCLHAHELIQLRKKARRRLGNAKAAISRRAKELLDKHNTAADKAA